MMPLRHCDARPGRVGKEVLRLTGVEDVGREGERGGQTRTLDRLRVGDVWRVEDRLAEESSGNGERVSMDDEGGGTERVDTVAGCVGGVANYSQKAGAGEEGVVEMVEIGETGSAVDRQTAGLSVVTGGAGDRGFQEEIQNAVGRRTAGVRVVTGYAGDWGFQEEVQDGGCGGVRGSAASSVAEPVSAVLAGEVGGIGAEVEMEVDLSSVVGDAGLQELGSNAEAGCQKRRRVSPGAASMDRDAGLRPAKRPKQRTHIAGRDTRRRTSTRKELAGLQRSRASGAEAARALVGSGRGNPGTEEDDRVFNDTFPHEVRQAMGEQGRSLSSQPFVTAGGPLLHVPTAIMMDSEDEEGELGGLRLGRAAGADAAHGFEGGGGGSPAGAEVWGGGSQVWQSGDSDYDSGRASGWWSSGRKVCVASPARRGGGRCCIEKGGAAVEGAWANALVAFLLWCLLAIGSFMTRSVLEIRGAAGRMPRPAALTAAALLLASAVLACTIPGTALTRRPGKSLEDVSREWEEQRYGREARWRGGVQAPGGLERDTTALVEGLATPAMRRRLLQVAALEAGMLTDAERPEDDAPCHGARVVGLEVDLAEEVLAPRPHACPDRPLSVTTLAADAVRDERGQRHGVLRLKGGGFMPDEDIDGRVPVPVGAGPSLRETVEAELRAHTWRAGVELEANTLAASKFWQELVSTDGFSASEDLGLDGGGARPRSVAKSARPQPQDLFRTCACPARRWCGADRVPWLEHGLEGPMFTDAWRMRAPGMHETWKHVEEILGEALQELTASAAAASAREAPLRLATTAAAALAAAHREAFLAACSEAACQGRGPLGHDVWMAHRPLAAWRCIVEHPIAFALCHGIAERHMDFIVSHIAAAAGLRDVAAELWTPAADEIVRETCVESRQSTRLAVRLPGLLTALHRALPLAVGFRAALSVPFQTSQVRCSGWSYLDGVGAEEWCSDSQQGRLMCVRVWVGSPAPDAAATLCFRRRSPAVPWAHATVELIAIQGDASTWGPLSVAEPIPRRPSRFLPASFRWTDTNKLLPDGSPDYASGLRIKPFACTGVLEHKRNWYRRVWPLDGTCRAILNGRFYFPTRPGGIAPSLRPNLGSVNEDKPLLYKMIAKYLISGALEWCPPGQEPLNLIPLGLVLKKDPEEPWRVIADGRAMNTDLLPWQTPMVGMGASAGLFTRGSYCFMKDFSSAYHNVPLGTTCGAVCVGCRACVAPASAVGGPRATQDQGHGKNTCSLRSLGLQAPVGDLRPLPQKEGRPAAWAQRTFVGCKPGLNCAGAGCQKQLFGIELDSEFFRFSVCHFGIRTSGNAWHALIAPLLRKWRDSGRADIILWVDDICVIVHNRCAIPRTCGGHDVCPACAECRNRARALDKEFSRDIRELGFQTNRKDVEATTCSVFLGLGFDTVSLEFWVEAAKAAEFAGRCGAVLQAGVASRRTMARLVGKLTWWRPAIPHARLLSRGMAAASLGATSDWEWDQESPVTGPAREDLVFWLENAESLAAFRMPMRVPTTADVEQLWEALCPEHVTVSTDEGALSSIAGRYRRAVGLRLGHAFYLQDEGGAGIIWFVPPRAAGTGSWCLGQVERGVLAPDDYVPQAYCRCHAEISLSPAAEPGPWRGGQPDTPGPVLNARVVLTLDTGRRRVLPPALQGLESRFLGRLVTDAGPQRWGATFTKRNGEVLRATNLYDADDVSRGETQQQPWREGLAVICALRALASELRAGVVLHHSDCECVVRAMQEGSVTSEVLQRQARRVWQECARLGILLYSGWVPGKEIVRLGVDALSREEGCDKTDVRTGQSAKAGVRRLCSGLGWTLTVDLFASKENAMAPRFCAWRHAGAEECVDAFSRPAWGYVDCQCGSRHSEVVYVFPPDPLLLPVWTRLRRDGARGIALSPHWVSAAWWSILKAGAVSDLLRIPGRDMQIGDVGKVASSLRNIYDARSYVLVAFDFSQTHVPCATPCAQVGPVKRSALEEQSAEARSRLLTQLSEAVKDTGR